MTPEERAKEIAGGFRVEVAIATAIRDALREFAVEAETRVSAAIQEGFSDAPGWQPQDDVIEGADHRALVALRKLLTEQARRALLSEGEG